MDWVWQVQCRPQGRSAGALLARLPALHSHPPGHKNKLPPTQCACACVAQDNFRKIFNLPEREARVRHHLILPLVVATLGFGFLAFCLALGHERGCRAKSVAPPLSLPAILFGRWASSHVPLATISGSYMSLPPTCVSSRPWAKRRAHSTPWHTFPSFPLFPSLHFELITRTIRADHNCVEGRQTGLIASYPSVCPSFDFRCCCAC